MFPITEIQYTNDESKSYFTTKFGSHSGTPYNHKQHRSMKEIESFVRKYDEIFPACEKKITFPSISPDSLDCDEISDFFLCASADGDFFAQSELFLQFLLGGDFRISETTSAVGFITQSIAQHEQITVKAGSKYSKTLKGLQAGDLIIIDYKCLEHDVKFYVCNDGLVVSDTVRTGDGKRMQLLYRAKDSGEHDIVWDNSFSKFRAKDVDFKCLIVDRAMWNGAVLAAEETLTKMPIVQRPTCLGGCQLKVVDVAALQEESETMKERLEQFEELNKILKNEILKYNPPDGVDANVRLRRQSREISRQASTIEALETWKVEHEALIKDLEDCRDSLMLERQQLKYRVSVLNNELESNNTDSKNLSPNGTEMTDESPVPNESPKSETSDLMETMKAQLSDKDGEIIYLKDSMSELQIENDRILCELDQINKEKSVFGKDLEEARQNASELSSSNQTLQNDKMRLEAEVANLKKEIRRFRVFEDDDE
eukprot:TRINITY_DN775897_c0_g1_i1.p1 TRINITY_DN775897_c0_g1~~TRINITY_DN775897_c0_g1_i1.p1  ORF type:complete len:484 (+),score=113.53 TRINITY_DN775897_c0_g1_i1:71-1522(+)